MRELLSLRTVCTVTRLLMARSESGDARSHLGRAMEWLARAQDSVGGGGVSYGFGLLEGWWPPYPETTGYCVPTFLKYARLVGDGRFSDRAHAMASWELSVQRADGGFAGGPIGRASPHAIPFDTGQVLQGWVAMHREGGGPELLAGAHRAANWLVASLASNGAWCDERVPARPIPRSYNARTAWALLELDAVAPRPDCRDAARRNIEWTLSCQHDNGWFSNCAFFPGKPPLTHTIAYVLEGLIGASHYLDDERILGAAIHTADALHRVYRKLGWLPATFDESWRSRDRYACIPGCAQTALVWRLIATLTRRRDLAEAAQDMNRWLRSVQLSIRGAPDLHGGLPGSSPIYGAYEPLRLPNWAAKFFADTMLAEIETPFPPAPDQAVSG